MTEVRDTKDTFRYQLARTLVLWYFRIMYRWRIEGAQYISEQGPVILASNHIHNFDPFLVGSCTRRFVHFMAKAELFRIRPVGAVFQYVGAFPVHRGGADKAAIKHSIAICQSGGCLMVFPEGHRSPDGQLQPGQPGVAMIARRSGCPIVPVAVVGPYRFRGLLTVRFGEPFSPDPGDTNDTLLEKLMARIRRLAEAGHTT